MKLTNIKTNISSFPPVDQILLRCPKCKQEMMVDRDPTDYPEAVRVEVTCPACNPGDFAEVKQFNTTGQHIYHDPEQCK